MDNLTKQDIEDMKEVLYFCYKSLKENDDNNKTQKPENLDIERLIDLKRKLNMIL
jgi:hypothetical protein